MAPLTPEMREPGRVASTPVLLPAITGRCMEAVPSKPPRAPRKPTAGATAAEREDPSMPSPEGSSPRAAPLPQRSPPPQSRRRSSSASPAVARQAAPRQAPGPEAALRSRSTSAARKRSPPSRSFPSTSPPVPHGAAPRVPLLTRETAATPRAASVGVPGGGSAPSAGARKLLYVAQFGNNSGLLRQLLRVRAIWTPGPGDPGNPAGKCAYEEKCVKVTPADDTPEIQLLWTQYAQRDFLSAMAERRSGIRVIVNEEAGLQMKLAKRPAAELPPPRAHNHFENGTVLTSKAGLRETMVAFYLRHGRDPFGAVPLTFVVRRGVQDPQYAEWHRAYEAIAATKGQRMWLVKPGEKANRGNGIRIYDAVDELAERVNDESRCWVVQKYMEAPLLIHRRKFDIRAYCLVTQQPGGGATYAFCYREAYLRTTSAKYSLKTKDRMVHLNNDAVQKKGENYGKYEAANKLSLVDFQRYLDEHHARDGFSVQEKLMPQVRALMADAIRAAEGRLNPRGIDNCFEVLGFDFMVDANGRVWLIEVNSNPCLELCNAYLSYLIPRMLEEALQLTVDRIFAQGPAAPANPGNGANTGWEPVYCSSGPDADRVSCDWVPLLPPDAGTPPDLAMLGRDLLASSLTPSSGGQRRRRGRSSSKGSGVAAAAGAKCEQDAEQPMEETCTEGG